MIREVLNERHGSGIYIISWQVSPLVIGVVIPNSGSRGIIYFLVSTEPDLNHK